MAGHLGAGDAGGLEQQFAAVDCPANGERVVRLARAIALTQMRKQMCVDSGGGIHDEERRRGRSFRQVEALGRAPRLSLRYDR